MFKKFYDDLTYLPKQKFSAKYLVPAIIALILLVIVGQIATMFITVNQQNKVSGTITSVDAQITEWIHHRGSLSDDPNYELVIALDNFQSYNIQEPNVRKKLSKVLKKGDYVTIYYPNLTLKILSAGFVRKVSQVERGKEVLYSWKDQQNENWFNIFLFSLAMAFFYWLRKYLNDYVDTSMLS